jgi:hypothetical protein
MSEIESELDRNLDSWIIFTSPKNGKSLLYEVKFRPR